MARCQDSSSPSKISTSDLSLCLDEEEQEQSVITLEEFKWNLKRLLHECCPEGIYLHDVEEAYFHWFHKMISTDMFYNSNHAPPRQKSDPVDTQLTADWAAVFRNVVQLKQTFILETVDDDIYKVRLRPGCIKPEENKIILALTEYSNCRAYMRAQFGQGRRSEGTESPCSQIQHEQKSSKSSINLIPAPPSINMNTTATDVSVQVELPGPESTGSNSPSPAKMQKNEVCCVTSPLVEDSFTTVEEPSATSTSLTLELTSLETVSSSHCCPGPTSETNSTTSLTPTKEPTETANESDLTDNKDKHYDRSNEDIQLQESYPAEVQQHCHLNLNSAEENGQRINGSNNCLDLNHSQIDNEDIGHKIIPQNQNDTTNATENFAHRNTDIPLNQSSVIITKALGDEIHETNMSQEAQAQTNCHLVEIMKEAPTDKHINGHAKIAVDETETSDNKPAATVIKPITPHTEVCNGNGFRSMEMACSSVIKGSQSQKPTTAPAPDTVPTILLKDILIRRQLRKPHTILEQNKHRCTYLGCSKYFNSFKERQRHLIDAHALNGLKYKCEVESCRKLFRTRESMLQHSATCSESTRTKEAFHRNGNGMDTEKRNSTERANMACPDFGVNYEENDEDQWSSDASSSSSSKRRKLGYPAKCDLNNCDKVIASSVVMNLHRLTNH